MRWFSLKGLLVLFSVWHVSQQMKDLLESIHPNVENSFELNSFLQDVMKMKKAFKEIRDAAADLSEDEEDSLTDQHMNDDIDEYVYDAENLEANRRKLNGGKHHESSNQLSHYHNGNRPSNDIYPHIYKEHADLDHEKGIRFRRQLIEDVQVEPKSSKGNIRVQGDKLNTVDRSFKSESTPNDARETLMAIFSEFLKSTLPYQDDVSGTTEKTPGKTENFETTPNAARNIILITNSRQEEVPQSKSEGNLKEKKKNYNIQIMEDGKIVRDYVPMENRVEHFSENDLSTSSTIPYDIRSSSGLQNGITRKIEMENNDRTNDDGTKTSTEDIDRLASLVIPITESVTMHSNKVKEHAPRLIGRKRDERKNIYRVRSAQNIRRHPYDNLEYLQQTYPRYSYIPNQNIYEEEYQSPYNVKYRPQIQTFKIKDNRRDMSDYPVNNEFYQLRRLKSVNESSQERSRQKRSIQEFLGMDNEDDYSEDLDFSTESVFKESEDQNNYKSMKPYQKLSTENMEHNMKMSTKKSKKSVESMTNKAPTISITSSDSSVKYYSKTSTGQTDNGRMKRAQKYRNLRKRKKLIGMKNRLYPVLDKSRNIKSKRNCDRNPEHVLHQRSSRESNKAYSGENQGLDSPSKVNNIEHYDIHSKSLRNPKFKNINSATNIVGNGFYHGSFLPVPNEIYSRPTYFHFVPFVPPEHFYHGNIHCIHYNPLKIVNANGDYFNNPRRSSSKSGGHNWNTFRGRKLMTNTDLFQKEHKRDIVSDIINGGKPKERKESMTKRTESDYGEEPDLSEGQTIKKHSKLKKYNKVEAPGKNFEDNYEFEETPNESSNPRELLEDQIGKSIEKNSKLEEDDEEPYRHSFRDKLAKLKHRLFNKENDEIDIAMQDKRTHSIGKDNKKRIERQQENDGSVALEELSNPKMGLTSNINFEPIHISDPHLCPDDTSSQGSSDSFPRNRKCPTCRWRFNPMSGTFEAIPCPCDPCEPPPCPNPWETPPPCPCPTTCNPCSTVTEINDHTSTVDVRSPNSELNIKSPRADDCPCSKPEPCCGTTCPCPPPPCPCDPCSCPNPCPYPCPCNVPSSDENDKLSENQLNHYIEEPFEENSGLIEPTNLANDEMRIGYSNPLSAEPFPYPFTEHYTASIPRIQFHQYPRQCLFMPNDVYKVYNSRESEKLGETNDENSFSSYDDSSDENIIKCPYPKNNQVYPFSSDPNYREFLEKSSIQGDNSNLHTQQLYETHVPSLNLPHYCPCPQIPPTYYPYMIHHTCPHPHSHYAGGFKVMSPSLAKRHIVLDVEQPERPLTSSDRCPCVFGYFLPCPHLTPPINQHTHLDHLPHIVNNGDENHEISNNGVPWIQPEGSPSLRDSFSQRLSFSSENNLRDKNSYIACHPSIPLEKIFSSQQDSVNLQNGPFESENMEDNNFDDSVNDAAFNDKRTLSRKVHSNLPRSFDQIPPNYFERLQGPNNVAERLSDVFPSKYSEYLSGDSNPTLYIPTYESYENPSESNSKKMVETELKGKRRCPKPTEPLPPCTGCPPSYSEQKANMNNDILAEKARRVNEYLKSKFLNGKYSMNNMMFPRSKRQLTSKNYPNSMSDSMAPAIRSVRRPHGVPRKPLNRKMPEQLDSKKDKTKYVRSDDEESQAESSIPYTINEEDQVQEEESYPKIQLDRKSRSFLNEGNHHNNMKSENGNTVKKKNRIELQDLHFAKEIIDSVIEKVNKNPNLKIKIGNALNKKKIYEAESNQQNHAKECNSKEQEDYEETRNLLRSVSCVLNKLVKKQIQEKLCEHLPNHLKNFLKHIVKPPMHRIKQRSNDKYHEDTFLFRAAYPQKKLNLKCKNRLEDNMMNLLNHYDQLDEESKKKAAPIHKYIINHMNMLKKIEDERGSTMTDHQSLNFLNEDKNVAFQNPVKFEGAQNNLDVVQRDLENSDLEQEQNSFEKVGLHERIPTKINEEDLETKLKKRDAIDDNYKSNIEKKGVKKSSKNDDKKVSEKYKKLIEAAEEVRCKRKNEEKIGEAFGKKDVKRNIESSDLHIIR